MIISDLPSANLGNSGIQPLWGRSILWLLFLGPFFFLSYGFSNQWAASKGVESSLFFAWEQHIPFLPWTIIPYWSIDLFYGLSFLFCRTPRDVDRHAFRLLTAQLIAVACFLFFPIRFAFERPPIEGFFGMLFGVLTSFDLPYNQAPSLHIALLIIIWERFASTLAPRWRWLVHVWSSLIGISVLTTYQHHFIDIPTGVLVGLFCLWLWPDNGSSPAVPRIGRMTRLHLRLSARYFLATFALSVPAFKHGGIALWGLWISFALLMVGIIYLSADGKGFQKVNGRHSLAVRLLLAPYRLGAWCNCRLWRLFRTYPPVNINANVWLGPNPNQKEFADIVPRGFSVLVDLCPELSSPRSTACSVSLPWLDLVPPTTWQLVEAARAIESVRQSISTEDSLLVCCALGYSRSVCAIVAWLYWTGHIKSVDEAIAHVRERCQHVVLGGPHLLVLRSLEGVREEESESVEASANV